MSYEIKTASRKSVRTLVGMFGLSGSGKTYSALLLARGFVGPKGKISIIDTEAGRGEIFSEDPLIGGYDALQLEAPFSPDNYQGAIEKIEQSGYSIGIIDSMSHEHEGTGGVCDMAMQISQRRAEKYNKDWDGVIQFGDWKQPKMSHVRLMLRLMQSKIPWIICLRAKFKSHQVRGTEEMFNKGIIERSQIGKMSVVKDNFLTPIQDEQYISEMTVHGVIDPEHRFRLIKPGTKDLAACFPDNDLITIEHGAKLAAWCAGGTVAGAGKTTPKPKTAKQLVWEATGLVASEDKAANATALYLWIIDHGIAPDTEDLSAASPERWAEILKAVEGVAK